MLSFIKTQTGVYYKREYVSKLMLIIMATNLEIFSKTRICAFKTTFCESES